MISLKKQRLLKVLLLTICCHCSIFSVARAASVRIGTQQSESIEIRQWPSPKKPIPTLIFTHAKRGPIVQAIPAELAKITDKQIKAWHAKIFSFRPDLLPPAICVDPVIFTGTKEPQNLCLDLVDRDVRFGFLQWFRKTAALTYRITN